MKLYRKIGKLQHQVETAGKMEIFFSVCYLFENLDMSVRIFKSREIGKFQMHFGNSNETGDGGFLCSCLLTEICNISVDIFGVLISPGACSSRRSWLQQQHDYLISSDEKRKSLISPCTFEYRVGSVAN